MKIYRNLAIVCNPVCEEFVYRNPAGIMLLSGMKLILLAFERRGIEDFS